MNNLWYVVAHAEKSSMHLTDSLFSSKAKRGVRGRQDATRTRKVAFDYYLVF